MTEHIKDDRISISGYLGGMRVSIFEAGISLKGSLAKYYLEDNIQTLLRSDVQRSIEKMSDEIHLPITQSKVTRIDLAQNYITNYQPECYYEFLGDSRYYKRLVQPKSLYYSNKSRTKLFYDKLTEIREKGYLIPDVWHNSYVLRYEYRLTGKAISITKKDALMAKDLYDEQVYISLINEYIKEYENINKVQLIRFNIEKMKTPNDFIKQLTLKTIQDIGQNNVMNMVEDLRTKKVFNNSESYSRLKGKIRELGKIPEITESSELINELDLKIRAVKQNYR